MTTFHCDKLCSCNTCAPIRWALKLATQDIRRAEVFVQYPPQTGDTGELQFEYEAMCAILDPAKLAELMVMGLRARGIQISIEDANEYGVSFLIWSAKHPVHGRPLPEQRWVSPAKVRSQVLAIMATPPDESSREACERILKGEP